MLRVLIWNPAEASNLCSAIVGLLGLSHAVNDRTPPGQWRWKDRASPAPPGVARILSRRIEWAHHSLRFVPNTLQLWGVGNPRMNKAGSISSVFNAEETAFPRDGDPGDVEGLSSIVSRPLVFGVTGTSASPRAAKPLQAELSEAGAAR